MKALVFALLGILALLGVRNGRAEVVAGAGDYVVILHGMGRTHRAMGRIEGVLANEGYRTINLRYSSFREPVAAHVETLDGVVRRQCVDKSKRVHFVTHSLGGLIVRAYLKEDHGINVGRVVMLAPPNRGSRLADITKKLRFSKFFQHKVGEQLGTDEGDLPKRLGPVGFELGVIAGDRTFNPLYSWIEPGPDDGKVAVENAKVAGMRDFLVVHSTHTFMIQRRYVIGQVVSFLKNGRFDRAADRRVIASERPLRVCRGATCSRAPYP